MASNRGLRWSIDNSIHMYGGKAVHLKAISGKIILVHNVRIDFALSSF